jgi:hypothetical protein
MSTFKVGDKVKCIDDVGTLEVVFGKIYTVKYNDGLHCQVKEFASSFFSRRFELVLKGSFPEMAMPLLLAGKKVRITDWSQDAYYEAVLHKQFGTIVGLNYFYDRKFDRYYENVPAHEYHGSDWEEYVYEPKLHKLTDCFDALRNNKKIRRKSWEHNNCYSKYDIFDFEEIIATDWIIVD